MIFKLIIIVSVLGLAVYGFWQYLTKSDIFRLKTIEIEGLKSLKKEDVISRAGIEPGKNIFAIDLKKIKKHLKSIRQIDNIKVVRSYPDAIFIRIIERVPIARIVNTVKAGKVELIDIEGVVFPGEAPGLPKITGITDDYALKEIVKFIPGIREADRDFYDNLSIIRGSDIRDIRLKAYGIDIRWGKIEVNIKNKLNDLKKVIENTKNKDCALIDVRFWKENKRDVFVK